MDHTNRKQILSAKSSDNFPAALPLLAHYPSTTRQNSAKLRLLSLAACNSVCAVNQRGGAAFDWPAKSIPVGCEVTPGFRAFLGEEGLRSDR